MHKVGMMSKENPIKLLGNKGLSTKEIKNAFKKGSGPSFQERVDAHNKLEPLFKNWLSSLSTQEKRSIFHYCYKSDKEMNGYLYGKIQTIDETSKQYIKNISEALQRSQTTVPFTVYKGVSLERLQDIFGDVSNEPINCTVEDKAFLSTSLLKELALKHANGALLEINVPKGANGAYVSTLSEYLEAELLFDKNQKLLIKDVKKENNDGKEMFLIKCDLVL